MCKLSLRKQSLSLFWSGVESLSTSPYSAALSFEISAKFIISFPLKSDFILIWRVRDFEALGTSVSVIILVALLEEIVQFWSTTSSPSGI